MASIFRGAAARIRNSAMLVPIYVVFVLLLLGGLYMFYEDYSTSRKGYETLPTLKVNPGVAVFVGLMPQLIEIGFAYIWASESEKGWAGMVSMTALLVDIATDTWYKAGSQIGPLLILAFFESVLIYTILSEVAITFGFGMCMELLPDLVAVLKMWVQKLSGALNLGGDDGEPQSPRGPVSRPLGPTMAGGEGPTYMRQRTTRE